MENWTLVAAASAAAAFVIARLISGPRSPLNLPPGPPKFPLIGNLLNMPAGMDYKAFSQLGKQYHSDVIHLSALGTSVVILNSYRAGRDLLDKRSAIYSSRPVTVMAHELCHMKMYFVFSVYGDFWRACRRLFTKYLNPQETGLHRSREVFYVRRFLGQLLSTPQDFREHIRHLVGSISISTIYGLKARPVDDPYIEQAEQAAEALSAVILGGTYLVDIIPFLKYLPIWFPGASFLKKAQEMERFNEHLRDDLPNASIKNLPETDAPSFISMCLQDPNYTGTEDESIIMKYTAGQAYAAAADTTVSAVASFFLAMVCYPDVQNKLQEELDTVVRDKFPTHEDIECLPYLQAVVMETLRWNPVTPIGIPHRLVEDDTYNGYFIPKDSIVVANQWAMLHDPQLYPDPFVFRPERFLKNGAIIDDSVLHPADMAFGFGRRICPGKHIAQSVLKITAASVLSAFDLLKVADKDGNVVEPNQEYEETVLSHPLPFPCIIQPRSPQTEANILAWGLQEDQDVHQQNQ